MRVRGIWILIAILGWGGLEGQGYGFTLPIPATPPSAEYPIPSGMYNDLKGIAVGPDANLWFAEGIGKIGKITPGGAITEFSAGMTGGAGYITPAIDGSMWFTEGNNNRIGKISNAGVITEYLQSTGPNQSPQAIVQGPQGDFWVYEATPKTIAQVSASGIILFEYGIPGGGSASTLIVGPDSNVWFTDSLNSAIGRIDKFGFITMFSTGITPGSAPDGLAVGPDGNLWFTESSADKIGRFNMQSGALFGNVTEFPGPQTASPLGKITSGSDGRMYFSMLSVNRIGAITTDLGAAQTIAEYSTSYPVYGICNGPDNNIWFTESAISIGSGVGRINVTSQAPSRVAFSVHTLPAVSDVPIYQSLCPSTPEGAARLMPRLTSLVARKMARAFTWDAINQAYIQFPVNSSTLFFKDGFFVATTTAESFDFSGTPQIAPYSITLLPGWNFIGIPPLAEGTLPIKFSHSWADFTLCDFNNVAITGNSRDTTIGTGAFYWDGYSYVLVTSLESGRGYWVRNSTLQTLKFSRINNSTGGVVFLSDQESSAGAAPTSASSSPALLPPPFPTFADVQPQHGCGTGGGVAMMIGLFAVLGLRQRGRQRRAG